MLGGYLILLIMTGSLFFNIFRNWRIIDLLFEIIMIKKFKPWRIAGNFHGRPTILSKFSKKNWTIVAIYWNWVFRVLRVMVYELLRTALVPGEGLVAVSINAHLPNNGRLSICPHQPMRWPKLIKLRLPILLCHLNWRKKPLEETHMGNFKLHKAHFLCTTNSRRCVDVVRIYVLLGGNG